MRLALMMLIAVSIIGYAPNDRLSVKKDAADPSRTICDVKFATFTVPKGWLAGRSGNNTYAALTPATEKYPDVTQLISIDIGKPTSPTAKSMAEAFAKKWNGSVDPNTLKVDGEEAFRVKVAPSHKELRPVDSVIVFRGERAFLLIGGSKEEQEIDKAIDELVASWKWK